MQQFAASSLKKCRERKELEAKTANRPGVLKGP